MNWLLIVVACIFLVGLIIGIISGAIKIMVSLLATVVTLVIVFFATPYVDETITKFVPIEEIVSTRVEDIIRGGIYSLGEEELGISGDATTIKNMLSAAGVTQEMLDARGITDEDIANGNISTQDLQEMGVSAELLVGLQNQQSENAENSGIGNLSKETQDSIIDESYIPDIFKKLLKANNTNDTYEKLGAEDFVSYAAAYLSKAIVNVITFLLTFVVVSIVLRAIIFALNIVSELPVVGIANRMCGGAFGLAAALVIVWLLFVVITLMFTTGIGRELMAMIESNTVLKLIYDYNPILKVATTFKI